MMAVFLLIMLLLNAIDKFLFRARNGTFLNIILSLLSVSLLFIPLPVGGGLPTENIFDLTVVIGYLVLRSSISIYYLVRRIDPVPFSLIEILSLILLMVPIAKFKAFVIFLIFGLCLAHGIKEAGIHIKSIIVIVITTLGAVPDKGNIVFYTILILSYVGTFYFLVTSTPRRLWLGYILMMSCLHSNALSLQAFYPLILMSCLGYLRYFLPEKQYLELRGKVLSIAWIEKFTLRLRSYAVEELDVSEPDKKYFKSQKEFISSPKRKIPADDRDWVTLLFMLFVLILVVSEVLRVYAY